MGNLDAAVVAAIVAALTSIATLLISLGFRTLWEKHFHVFKLREEYKYEQRKKLKEILSRNKIQLLNSSESLNRRLWNFTSNYKERWHNASGNYGDAGYYFRSFVYRFAAVFA